MTIAYTQRPETAHQRLEGNTIYQQPGLYVEPVMHEGNQNSSAEEAEKVLSIVNDLLKGDVYWWDCNGKKHELKSQHIKIISPYNAQVEKLENCFAQ